MALAFGRSISRIHGQGCVERIHARGDGTCEPQYMEWLKCIDKHVRSGDGGRRAGEAWAACMRVCLCVCEREGEGERGRERRGLRGSLGGACMVVCGDGGVGSGPTDTSPGSSSSLHTPSHHEKTERQEDHEGIEIGITGLIH